MLNYLCSLTILFPLLGVLGLGLSPLFSNSKSVPWIKWIGLVSSILSSLCAFALLAQFNKGATLFQGLESLSWVDSYSIAYAVGLDGLNAPLVLLIAVIFPILIGAEWKQPSGRMGMQALFLLLQATLIGVVTAQNLFLVCFFWLLSALPFYFLFIIWGDEAREKAGFRFFVTASAGSALFFVVLILIYYSVDPNSFSIKELFGGKFWKGEVSMLGLDMPVSRLAFLLFALSFMLRIPIWPIHGWFTYAMTQAPASVAIAFGGVFVPVALYLFTKLGYLIFPMEMSHFQPWILAIGEVGFIFSAILCVAQRELRMVFAYLCMNQIGLSLVGIASGGSAGVVGSLYHEFAFGLALSGFGLFFGLLRERTEKTSFLGDDGQPHFGGVVRHSPVLTLTVSLILGALLCVPGLGGFVGQSLILIGGFGVSVFSVLVIGASFVVLVYGLFQVFMKIFLGHERGESKRVFDLTWREKLCFTPIVGLLIVFGVYPKPLLDVIRPSVAQLLAALSA
ncbi:MAG: NuoM family protein [Bacteriovoracia bacterium]